MTKQPKEFKSRSPKGGSFGSPDEWKDTWKKIAKDNRQALAQYMQDTGVHPYTWLDKPLFNPEEVTNLFTQTMKTLSEQAESAKDLHHSHLVDVQAFLYSTMDRFQTKSARTRLKPSSGRTQFQNGEWEENPFFYLLQQSYLLNVQFQKEAAGHIGELDHHISRKLSSYTRHLVDALSLSTFPLKNAKDIQDTLMSPELTLGQSWGVKSSQKSGKPCASKGPMNAFHLGKNLGITPGKVVFQNDLFQLIRYESLSSTVAKRPLFIVPPWINKYYIFDLSSENSFIRWALESGLNVFVMSWVNPDERHANMTMTDYALQGVKVGLDQVCKISRQKKVNVVGYCSGGTLLGGVMAYLKAKKDARISSATFLAAPFDFSKIDELGIYRCESLQIKLEEYVQKRGYLERQYMVQAFNLLQANDLIWSSEVNHYLLGQTSFPFDMLYWTCDGLRMPTKMHSTYLREIFIENRLMKQDGLSFEDTPVDLGQISTPLFVMAAQEDHLAPWRSVYALTQMTGSSSMKFILGASGHVGGVFNPPSSQKYHYRVADHLPQEADEWFESSKKQEGSWWGEWRQWVEAYGGGTVSARSVSKDHILEDAPGSYAKEKKDMRSKERKNNSVLF